MNSYFTDGGKRASTNIMAWAWVSEDGEEYDSHAEEGGTNQVAELKAILAVLKHIDRKPFSPSAKIHSDSAYCVNMLMGVYNKKTGNTTAPWYKNWQRNGYVNSKKEPVANQEIIKAIVELFEKLDVELIKVRGHSDNKMNNLADELVNEALDELEEELDTHEKRS